MNIQNITHEEWMWWKPLENLPAQCWIDTIDIKAGQLIILVSDDKETCTISLKFNNNFHMYKITEENCTLELLDDIIVKYGKPFVYDSAFYLIHNSSYVEWLVQQSKGWLQADKLYHYCIFGVDSVLDVIASQEPEVKITYNESELFKEYFVVYQNQ